MSVFAEALEEAQGVDLAFDNYREDIRLGHKKIFYSADICRKVVDDKGVEVVKQQHEKAKQMLIENRGKLDEIAKYLYEKETITGEEFMRILTAVPQLPTGAVEQ